MEIQKHITYGLRTDFTENEAAILAWFSTMGYDHFKRSLKIDPAVFDVKEDDIRSVFVKLQDMRKEVFRIADMKKKK